MKWMKSIGILIIAIFVFVGCGSEEATTTTANESSTTNTNESATNVVTIKASNFAFDAEQYKVKLGEPVTIQLENTQGIHGIGIQGLDVKLDPNKKSVTITPDKAGSYEIVCTIMCGAGHADMKALFVVE